MCLCSGGISIVAGRRKESGTEQWRSIAWLNPEHSALAARSTGTKLRGPRSWSLTLTSLTDSPSDHSTSASTVCPEAEREIALCIKRALDEDLGSGDATTNNIVSDSAEATARIVSKQDGVVSGLEVAQAVFRALDQGVEFSSTISE